MCSDCKPRKQEKSNDKQCPKCQTWFAAKDEACPNCRRIDNMRTFLESSGSLI